MQHDEFIGLVQHRARLDSRGAAEAATRATLETLGERLAGGQPSNLGGQLPQEIRLHLERQDGPSESFGLQEFYERVADREGPGVDLPQAAFHARAVLSVVDEAITGAGLRDVRDQRAPSTTTCSSSPTSAPDEPRSLALGEAGSPGQPPDSVCVGWIGGLPAKTTGMFSAMRKHPRSRVGNDRGLEAWNLASGSQASLQRNCRSKDTQASPGL
jgi:uncharacterized protein (DUF2267 family)